MTLTEFRIAHSTLIEHYQFIEAHLEGIYAKLHDDTFMNGLTDVEYDNIKRILVKIETTCKTRNIVLFTQETISKLLYIINRRNYWCHNCYYDMVFEINGNPAKKKDIASLQLDLHEACEMREYLYDKFMNI